MAASSCYMCVTVVRECAKSVRTCVRARPHACMHKCECRVPAHARARARTHTHTHTHTPCHELSTCHELNESLITPRERASVREREREKREGEGEKREGEREKREGEREKREERTKHTGLLCRRGYRGGPKTQTWSCQLHPGPLLGRGTCKGKKKLK